MNTEGQKSSATRAINRGPSTIGPEAPSRFRTRKELKMAIMKMAEESGKKTMNLVRGKIQDAVSAGLGNRFKAGSRSRTSADRQEDTDHETTAKKHPRGRATRKTEQRHGSRHGHHGEAE